MRTFLVTCFLLVSVPAVAMNQSIVDYCFTTPNPKGCLTRYVAEEQAYHVMLQREAEAAVALEQARIQAQGLMFLGVGAAFVNGFNQHLYNMQLPYVSTPQFIYAQPSRGFR